MAKKKTGNQNGSKWISRVNRLAVYIRDEYTCYNCGITVKTAVLSLDHVQPRSQGINDSSDNLITCCVQCNSERGDTPIELFVSPEKLQSINEQLALDISPFVATARNLLKSMSYGEILKNPHLTGETK